MTKEAYEKIAAGLSEAKEWVTNACFCTGKDASGMCRCEKMHKYRSLSAPKPKLTTVWEGDSLDILAREYIEGLTKHQPKGKNK